MLEYLLLEMRACEPGSPVWRHAIQQLRDALPSRARGEYGAKIAPRASEENVQRAAREAAEQIKEYQSAAPHSAGREGVYQKIHAPVVGKPKGCVSCHGGTPARLDFEALGYSPARIERLRSTPNAQLMQDIQEGRQFHLPEMLEGGRAR